MQARPLIFTVTLMGAIAAGASLSFAKTTSTQDFVHNASIANMFEIESSQMALNKSHNSDVTSLAQEMVDDHTATGEKMKQVLASSDTDAQASDTLDDKHQALLDTLDKASDSDFDKKYIAIQKNAHQDAVRLFTDYSQHGKDSDLKAFAGETLPALKEHLKHVQNIKLHH